MSKLNFTKRSTEIVKMKAGDNVAGAYIETKSREMMDKLKGSPTFGELKDVPEIHFNVIDPTTGELIPNERFIIFGDAGLMNEIKNSGVKEGDLVMLEKGDKIELDNGARYVNSYTISIAE